MRYFVTPEFHRNLWLKFSLFKLWAVPVTLLLMGGIAFNLEDVRPIDALLYGSLWTYYVIVILWGNYEAATTLQDEVKGKTWDFQKMSSIAPAQLAFGKLYGATSYIWYAGIALLCIFAYAYSHYIPKHWYGGMGHIPAPSAEKNVFFVTFFLFLSGITGHAFAFLASFSDMASARNKLGRLYTPHSITSFILGVIAAHAVFYELVMENMSTGRHSRSMLEKYSSIDWFAWRFDSAALFDSAAFIALSLIFFLGWSLIGIYRTARTELSYPTTPSGWTFFVLSTSVYFAGFIKIFDEAGSQNIQYLLYVYSFIFCTILIINYPVMLAEAADFEKYRRFFFCVRHKDIRGIFQNMPRWIAALFFILIFYLLALTEFYPLASEARFSSLLSLFTSAILFVARDGIVAHGIHMGTQPRNIRFYLIFYFALSYLLLPLLHFSMMDTDINYKYAVQQLFFPADGQQGIWNNISTALAIYYPTAFSNILGSLWPVMLEIIVALVWLNYRKRKMLAE